MARAQPVQFNVRSAFAKARANELALQTGRTATQVVEDALRAYVPPGEIREVGRLVRRGRLLVMPRQPGSKTITLEVANAALEASRERDLEFD